MRYLNIGCKRSWIAAIKTILVLALFIAVLFLPEKTACADDSALVVKYNGETVRAFSLDDLQNIADDEGSLSYDYSSWNSEPAFNKYSNVQGPTVEAVLQKAELTDKVTDKCTVSFEGADGGTAVLTGKQLLETRYYYPNGDETDFAGGAPAEEAYADEVETKAVISTDAEHDNGLYIGQTAPNEENAELFIKNISAGGVINISSNAAPVCAKATADQDSGTWRPGKEIDIALDESSPGNAVIRYGLSTSRSFVPGYGSAVYNYGQQAEQICRPVIPDSDNSVYLCIVVSAYGMQDSGVQRYLYTPGDALTVKVDGEAVKTYDPEELSKMMEEGSLDYSGYNSYPTFSLLNISDYVRVDRIIEDATGKGAAEYDPDCVIKVASKDGYSASFTLGQLFGVKRYYYPNAEAGTDIEGSRVLEEAYEGRSEVPAIILLKEDKKFLFGQEEPNEQNYPECVKYMLSGGILEIRTENLKKCCLITKADPADGSMIDDGTEIYFALPDEADMRDKIHYLVDPAEGQVPGSTDDLYNYAPYRYNPKDRPDLPHELVNAPKISGAGAHSVALKVFSYAKRDGDVAVFRYFVRTGVSAELEATAASYNSIKLVWNKQPSISGYRLYRKEANGRETLYKEFGSETAAFTDTGLKTGTQYTYRLTVTAVCPDGVTGEFPYSGSSSAKPVLGKSAIKKLTAGKRKITVKWNKVAGANGYEIYRSLKKSSGYKKVKTVTKGTTLTFVNKKLKKGKRYYYKIRAYRKVGSKKVNNGFSAVKNGKVK